MNFIDLATLMLGTLVVLMVFIAKTDLEKSRVKVRARVRPRK